MNKNIYIYYGPGASTECVLNTAYTLKQCLSTDYQIRTLQPDELISGDWKKDAALFLLPGGADLPYVQFLTPVGNLEIKNYIESGGSFLGICAGAYYASNFVCFAPGTELEVIGNRQLSFFPGTVKGPCLKPYDYKTKSGAYAAEIKLTKDLSIIKVFYNGGGFFVGSETIDGVENIATYTQDAAKNKAAIISLKYGKGLVVLSGVHLEYDPELLDSKDSFLKPIALNLKNYDQERVNLVKSILQNLGLKTKDEKR